MRAAFGSLEVTAAFTPTALAATGASGGLAGVWWTGGGGVGRFGFSITNGFDAFPAGVSRISARTFSTSSWVSRFRRTP